MSIRFWLKNWVSQASTRRTSPLIAKLSVLVEVKENMDRETQFVVLLCECEIQDLTTVVGSFLKVCYVRWSG
jgi:hypothetical protein